MDPIFVGGGYPPDELARRTMRELLAHHDVTWIGRRGSGHIVRRAFELLDGLVAAQPDALPNLRQMNVYTGKNERTFMFFHDGTVTSAMALWDCPTTNSGIALRPTQ